MKNLVSRAIFVAILAASSASLNAAPTKPPKPTPPTNPTPGGDYTKCVATGTSVQVCQANYPG